MARMNVYFNQTNRCFVFEEDLEYFYDCSMPVKPYGDEFRVLLYGVDTGFDAYRVFKTDGAYGEIAPKDLVFKLEEIEDYGATFMMNGVEYVYGVEEFGAKSREELSGLEGEWC